MQSKGIPSVLLKKYMNVGQYTVLGCRCGPISGLGKGDSYLLGQGGKCLSISAQRESWTGKWQGRPNGLNPHEVKTSLFIRIRHSIQFMNSGVPLGAMDKLSQGPFTQKCSSLARSHADDTKDQHRVLVIVLWYILRRVFEQLNWCMVLSPAVPTAALLNVYEWCSSGWGQLLRLSWVAAIGFLEMPRTGAMLQMLSKPLVMGCILRRARGAWGLFWNVQLTVGFR